MKTLKNTSLIIAIIALTSFVLQEVNNIFKTEQIKDAAELAKIIKDPKAVKPAIFNVGPMPQIKGAVKSGIGASLSGQEQFEYDISKLPKNKEVIVYCGCCKLKTCPNIKPVLDMLNTKGFKNAKVLNLPNNLQEDWIDKGFPMDK